MMGVDLSIYNALLQPGPSAREISNALADRRMREQDQATARQLNALQLGSAQQAADDDMAMRNALSKLTPSATLEQRTAALRAIPSQKAWGAADALEKAALERRKVTADVGTSEFDLQRKKQSALVQQVASLNSPDDAMQLLNGMVQSGEVPPQLANGYANLIKTDPKWQLKLIMGISDPSKMLELLKPHLQTVNAGNAQVQQVVDPITGKVTETGRTQIFQSPDSVASVAATIRGQDITDKNARLGREQADRHFNTTQENNKNSGTVEERNAAGYSARMAEATKLLDKYEETGKPSFRSALAETVPFVGDTARRFNSTPDQQMYRQAQEDWVRAKLRKESGAAIGKDEMEREIATYFPQVGDSAEVVAQKKQARLVANEAMKKSSGRAAYASEVKPAAPPDIDSLVDKYRTPK